jgi:DtxR family Mn-dependent transcriptional regulator
MHQLTPSQENYLEWIFRLSLDGQVRMGDLASRLGVKAPSASRAVAGLARLGLVKHQVYGRIELTPEGERVGRALARRSDCLTRLLVDVLGMDSAAAVPEVHRLEHVLGREVHARLEILVEYAGTSPAWVKRLRHRIEQRADLDDGPESFGIGRTEIHVGLDRRE